MLMKLKKDIFNFKSQFYNGRRVLSSIPPPSLLTPQSLKVFFLLNIMSKALTYGGDGGGRGGGILTIWTENSKVFSPLREISLFPTPFRSRSSQIQKKWREAFLKFFSFYSFLFYNIFERRRYYLLANKESVWLVCLRRSQSQAVRRKFDSRNN